MSDTATVIDPDDVLPRKAYVARLLFRVEHATSPHDAVLQMIDQINAMGLKGWVYRVEDAETGELTHVDAYGNEIDIEALAAEALEEELDAEESDLDLDDDEADDLG